MKLKQEGWKALSMGAFAHLIGNMYFFYDVEKKYLKQSFYIGNTIGVSLDIYAFYCFRKYKKTQKTKPKID